MTTIERQYLPPLNPDTTITEADRARIYDLVRRQLAATLEGNDSYYPDGVQKSIRARADDLNGLVESITGLQGRVNDPANILGDVVRYLKVHADTLNKRIEGAEPTDQIELPPDRFPLTRDRNELYLDPNPIAPPMRTLPRPREDWSVSAKSGTGGLNGPERHIAPPIFFPF